MEFAKIDSTSIISIRHLDTVKLKSYAVDRHFIYDDTAPINTDWWDRFWRWFWSLLQDAVGNGPTGQFIGYLALGILVGLIVYLIFRLLGLDLKFLTGKSKSIDVPYAEVEDNIHEINFIEEIEKALAANNFRLAIRLFYLRTLKQLSDANQIDWKPEKTNQNYINELADLKHRSIFKQLTDQFEYVWYGEFSIDKSQFDQLKSGFENFKPKSI